MRMYDIIEKKKRGIELTSDEIDFFVTGTVNGAIPDYQISAFLMAVYFKSMTDAETAALTGAMARSGDTADLSVFGNMTADKHSTGGVGDKTTLIAAPIAAALGCKVAKMSGRGLGHTGGTLDKLESIPGLSVLVSPEDFMKQVEDIGIAIIGQSGNMVPADKRLYALRDVTATVDSAPLIASSVMSKKLAAGCKNIVLDVKYGSGAFMKTTEDARVLAEKMIAAAHAAGRGCAAVISSMEQPLGYAVGNALEVKEAVDVLKGGGPADLRELSLTLAALMYSLASGEKFDECATLCESALTGGAAYEKFRRMVEYQGGDTKTVDDARLLPRTKNTLKFAAEKQGYIHSMDTEKIGVAACVTGAGRATAEDMINPASGIVFEKKAGDYVEQGGVIAVIHADNNAEEARDMLKDAVVISDSKPELPPLIYEIIK